MMETRKAEIKQEVAAPAQSALAGGVRRRIATAAMIIMVGNIASRLLGLVREQVIAALFGTTGYAAAFVAASAVPTALYDLLIGGALSAALIPVFSEIAEREGDPALSRLGSVILTLSATLLIPIIIVLALFTPQLVMIYAGNLPEADRELTGSLIRIMLPAVFFIGISGISTALLYARHIVTYPAFTVAIYNAAIIVCALILSTHFGPVSLVIGVLAGAVGQVVLQLPGLRGMNLRLLWDIHHPALKRIMLLYAPVAVGILISNIAVAIDRNLASRISVETMPVMRYATTLVQLPLGLVGTAMSFAILPTLSRLAITKNSPPADVSSYKETVALGIKLVLLAILPMAAGLVVLREPVVRLLFQHGIFDPESTNLTALAFLAYAPSIPFAAVDQILIAAYYARKNTLIPMLAGIADTGIYLVVALSLVGALGMPGLVLANSAKWIGNTLILFFLLWRSVGGLRRLGLENMLVKVGLATLVLAAIAWGSMTLLGSRLNQEHLSARLILVIIPIIFGGLVYTGTLLVLRVEELSLLFAMIRRRLSRAGRQTI